MKRSALCVALTAAMLTGTPISHADMLVGNYSVLSDRDPGHQWIWSIRSCNPVAAGCVRVHAVPQPNGQAAPYQGIAQLSNGRYTMTVDVPDGVRCVVQFFPSHDVYSWDAVTLAGSVDSTFDAGCGGGPGGTASYPFSLLRL